MKHEEEVWQAADARADSTSGETSDRDRSWPTVRGYDKRLVYGIGGLVLVVFIGFSFLGGPSDERATASNPPGQTAGTGSLVADPPYAAVRRDPPFSRPDTAAESLVPPPSSAVIGGADGRPYSSVGSAPPAAGPRESAQESTEAPAGHLAEAKGDPRQEAWRAVRDAAPASGWGRTSEGAVTAFAEQAPAWDPEAARSPAADSSGEAIAPAPASAPAPAPAPDPNTAPARRGTFVVPALSRMEAALVTAVNSDVPGDVVAQISRDVVDATGRNIAVPAGSRLLGKQTDQVAVGQRRVVIAWSALQLPDGTLVELPSLPAADESGAAGLPGQVSSRAAGAFGRALLLSAIGAGFQLSQPASGDDETPSAGRAAAAAVGQQLAELSAELLRRDVNARPTIRLRQGSYLTVMVARDLSVPARRWTAAHFRPGSPTADQD